MDYAFDLSMAQAAIWSTDPAALARDRMVRGAARAALQRSLGGSPAHVLSAWLDCLADGGLPPCIARTQDMSEAQQRWYDACGSALDASFQASGFDVHGLSPEEYGEMMELAWVSVAPAVPAECRGKAVWQEVFLARLSELRYESGEQSLQELAEQEFDWHNDQHPLCAADYLVGLTELSGPPGRARDDHPFYRTLRAQLVEALTPPPDARTMRAMPRSTSFTSSGSAQLIQSRAAISVGEGTHPAAMDAGSRSRNVMGASVTR